jgi:hypothetical protein
MLTGTVEIFKNEENIRDNFLIGEVKKKNKFRLDPLGWEPADL